MIEWVTSFKPAGYFIFTEPPGISFSNEFTPFEFCIFLFQFLWWEFLHVHSDRASHLSLFLLHQQILACSPVPCTVWWHLLCSSIWPDTYGCLGPTRFTSNCLSRSKQGEYNINTTICVCGKKTNNQEKQPSVVWLHVCPAKGLLQFYCWSCDQLSVNTKTVCFWKILLAGTEKAY